MQNFIILSDAIMFIEENICNEITQEDIADSCYCSLSNLQKLFRYAFHFTVKDYIQKRRMTLAANDILKSNMSITDVSMKYCYGSPEVFTRAFARVWGVNPSAFCQKWKFTGLFPRIIDFDCEYRLKGGNAMRKKVDISEIYEVLRGLDETYVLCFDVCNLMKINSISRELGDKVILEALYTIDRLSDDNMLLFRIGGDEFALVTGFSDTKQTEEVARAILSENGKEVELDGNKCELALRAGAMKMKSNSLRYHKLYDEMQNVINNAKKDGEILFLAE